MIFFSSHARTNVPNFPVLSLSTICNLLVKKKSTKRSKGGLDGTLPLEDTPMSSSTIDVVSPPASENGRRESTRPSPLDTAGQRHENS